MFLIKLPTLVLTPQGWLRALSLTALYTVRGINGTLAATGKKGDYICKSLYVNI